MLKDNDDATSPSEIYSESFFDLQATGSKKASEVIVPLLMSRFSPSSVLDVGCGSGEWLNTFKRSGVSTVMGVDGGFTTQRQLSESEFQEVDLTQTDKINLPKNNYDLAMSLEVAEHLPEEQAENFVNFLCDKSDVVVFSAAIPHQGGHHHLNERWQSYWKQIFASRGYHPDCSLRPLLWSNSNVRWWYAQNITIYEKHPNQMQSDAPFDDSAISQMIDIVHPKLLGKMVHRADPDNIPIRKAAKQLMYSIKKSLKRRMRLNR